MLATSVVAEDKPAGKPPEKLWASSIGAGVAVTSGNTDTKNYNLSFTTKYDPKTKVVSFWTMGFNQHTRGVWCNNLVYNIHLLTGKISEPGNSPFSLTKKVCWTEYPTCPSGGSSAGSAAAVAGGSG